MNITIRINTDSTAFENSLEYEIFSTLCRLAVSMYENGLYNGRKIYDSNGQVCGSVKVQESEDRQLGVRKTQATPYPGSTIITESEAGE